MNGAGKADRSREGSALIACASPHMYGHAANSFFFFGRPQPISHLRVAMWRRDDLPAACPQCYAQHCKRVAALQALQTRASSRQAFGLVNFLRPVVPLADPSRLGQAGRWA